MTVLSFYLAVWLFWLISYGNLKAYSGSLPYKFYYVEQYITIEDSICLGHSIRNIIMGAHIGRESLIKSNLIFFTNEGFKNHIVKSHMERTSNASLKIFCPNVERRANKVTQLGSFLRFSIEICVHFKKSQNLHIYRCN